MRIIFCDSVIDHKSIEPDYEGEKNSALKTGFDFSLISYEELIEGNVSKSIKYVSPAKTKELAIYRGWMLRPGQYEALYNALFHKNIHLINSPTAYQHCHYLPESYEKIKSKTPQSVWTTKLEMEVILQLTSVFGANPIIVKDFVKSAKHHWKEACFIPNASNAEQVKTIVDKFLELRGSSLNEGLVFRKFEELQFLGTHSKSGMPVTMEFRLFFVFQKPLSLLNYWDEAEYGELKPDIEEFIEIAESIESNFFTIDIARKESGEWIIMELGDGQVAGLPESAKKDEFYKKLMVFSTKQA